MNSRPVGILAATFSRIAAAVATTAQGTILPRPRRGGGLATSRRVLPRARARAGGRVHGAPAARHPRQRYASRGGVLTYLLPRGIGYITPIVAALKVLRIKLGWSQNKLSIKGGMMVTTIHRTEQGHSQPSAKLMSDMAEAMGHRITLTEGIESQRSKDDLTAGPGCGMMEDGDGI